MSILIPDHYKSVKKETESYSCVSCGSLNLWYRIKESSCGGYEDYCYLCEDCGYQWWCESADA